MSIDDLDMGHWRREYEQRQYERARNLDLAVDWVATGQATVAEAAHLAGASRQTIQARCSQGVRFKVMRRFANRQRVGKWQRRHSASGCYWQFLRRPLKFACRFASTVITVASSEGNLKEAAVIETSRIAKSPQRECITLDRTRSQDARFQVPSLQADGTPCLNIKGQPMTHADILGVRRRHLDGLWTTAVEKWTAAVEKHEADEAE
jgi:hypothetical protein